MFVALNAPSGSWTAMSESTGITQRFTVKAVLFASGSFAVPVKISNGVYTSGSYASPLAPAFIQLKDANAVGFYSRGIGVGTPYSPTFVLDSLSQPLTVTLPISYFHTSKYNNRTKTNKATVIVFGEYAK